MEPSVLWITVHVSNLLPVYDVPAEVTALFIIYNNLCYYTDEPANIVLYGLNV